jgi:hypothetical protein
MGLRLALKPQTSRRTLEVVGIKLGTEGSFMPTHPPVVNPPRTLIEGQRLDQPTFHALYEAMPPGTRAARFILQSLMTASWKLSRACTSTVIAAHSAGSTAESPGASPIASSFLASDRPVRNSSTCS